MAITIQSSPTSPTPAYNENWVVATSSQTAQPNFYYTIILTDVTGSHVYDTENIKPDPNNKLKLDLQSWVQLLMRNYIPVNLYGWKKCADATRKFRFNIGETYDVLGVATYFAGSNTDYITWNARVDEQFMAPYSANYFTYDSSIPNIKYLTTLPNKTYIDRSQYLYVLCQANVNELTEIAITTYDAAGNILGYYFINRPDSSTGLYSDNYQCIDVGYKGLLGITAPFVTAFIGTYPIITPSVASYNVYNPSAAESIQTITIECNPKYEVYSLHYLNSKGGYQTLHCNLAATLSSTKTTTSFKKSGWSLVSNVMTLDPALNGEKTQSVTIQDKLQLNSDWLTDAEFALHKDLFASTDVRLDIGSTTTYKGVKVTQTGYTTKNTDRLRNYQIDLDYTHQNHRQRG
jgi:hypothetical protein